MRIENLPSPGMIASGLSLRTEAAKAISYAEIMATTTGTGKSTQGKELSTFFAACKAAADAVTDTVVPTIKARAISAAAPTKVKLTFSEPLDATVVPDISVFTLAAPAKTISSVEVSDTTVVLTVTAAYAVGDAPTVAYTRPGTNGLRDPSGNLVATLAATAISRVA